MSARVPVAPCADVDKRLRQVVLIIRQAAYGMADELGRLYGLERPCKMCEQERRHQPPATPRSNDRVT